MITSGYGRSASDTPHPRTPAAQLQARCGQRDAAASARSRCRPTFTRHRTDGALRYQPRSTSLTPQTPTLGHRPLLRGLHPTRRNKWVFGDRETGAYLHHYAWTKIVRHAPVPGRHSPDDPALAQYWADRRRKRKPPQLAPSWERALRTQRGRCPLRREPLLHMDDPPDSFTQWETWYRGIRKALAHQAITQTSSGPTIHRLVHTDCARRQPGPVQHDPDQPTPDA